MPLLESLGLAYPVIQAGMGAGVAGAELAAAVSGAGALGTIGFTEDRGFGDELRQAKKVAGNQPVAANLIVPFSRQAHIDACIANRAAMVVLHGGFPAKWIFALRRARIPTLCTVGSATQTRRAIDAGADGVVAQGLEAGGHLMADRPLAVTLPEVLDAAGGRPVLAAGGIADADDVRAVVSAGADGAVAGTRFLLTEESQAHPEYKQRVLGAERTLRTMLFGMGWPLAHRVVPNALTDRWCGRSELGPASARVLNRAAAPLVRHLPLRLLDTVAALQRTAIPIYGPTLPLVGMPTDIVDRTALYAGDTLHRIDAILSAEEAVKCLAP